jgi:hypothetical protein
MVQDQWKINATLPDSFNAISYMHSTAGQVNLNTRVFPRSPYFQAPERNLPLEAVFQNLSPTWSPGSFVSSIISYQTDQRGFNYVGELSNVPGYTGVGGGNNTQWNQEILLRNMAGCLTTKSNTFGVWGVAQAIQKLPKNTGDAAFESGDQVLGEKRFYALVERYIWPGKDGVPGNGHTTNAGNWDRLATQSAAISSGVTNSLYQLPGSPPLLRPSAGAAALNLDTSGKYPPFDGPEPVAADTYLTAALGKVSWQASSLENAYNPPQPAIKYRVVYFKYLDQ